MTNSSCPICLDEFKNDRNMIILECGHKYDINCYTQYVIHKTKDILKSMEEELIQCPYCRSKDVSMLFPMITILRDNVEKEMCYTMMLEDLEDIMIKQYNPTLLAILDGERRFNKRNLVNSIRMTIKNNNKLIKDIFKDYDKII